MESCAIGFPRPLVPDSLLVDCKAQQHICIFFTRTNIWKWMVIKNLRTLLYFAECFLYYIRGSVVVGLEFFFYKLLNFPQLSVLIFQYCNYQYSFFTISAWRNITLIGPTVGCQTDLKVTSLFHSCLHEEIKAGVRIKTNSLAWPSIPPQGQSCLLN